MGTGNDVHRAPVGATGANIMEEPVRVKLLTFRYSATLGGFDDTPLRDFIRDKEVLSFREHFFAVNETPHLACVVTYQDAVVSAATLEAAAEIRRAAPAEADARSAPIPGPDGERSSRAGRTDRPDPAAGLGERERALFNTLREWRAKKARRDGVPPYVVLTNRQLIEVVTKRPESRTALTGLDGIGSAKVERYGGEILTCLYGRAPEPAAAVTAPCPSSVEAPAAPPLPEPATAGGPAS